MNTNPEDFVHFTCAKLVKNSEGKKEVKYFPKGGWKGKTKEQYKEMCKKTDKVKCVVTGKINGFTVFDFDTEEGYYKTIEKYPYLKDCFTVKTSKGFHIYTKYNPSFKTTTNTNVEIDVRNDDGLAFGAGTKTEFETEYRVYHDGSLNIEAPAELYKLINPDFNEKKPKDNKLKIKVKETEDQTETVKDDEETLIVAIINNISDKYLTEYSDWIKIVWAMRKVGLNKEFAIKISKKAPNYSDEGFDRVWNSKKCDTVGIGTLKWYSRKSDEFKHFEIIAQFDNFPECLKESTDRVMARLIVDLTEDDIIYQKNEVYVWYNNRWIFDDKGHIVKKVAEHSLIIYFHQLNDMYSKKMIASEPESEEYNSWFGKMKIVKSLITKIHTVSCMRNYYEAVLEELSGSEVVIEFDMKPYLFSFNNKCYDLESKEWVEPSKYDYILTKTGNDYIEPTEEQKEKVKTLMEQVFPDPEIRKCYMSVLFQGMVGQHTEKFVIANGRGRNGKGMTNELFMSLIGNYGYDMNISILTEKLKGGSNPEIANMHKKRFGIATEPSDSTSINNGTVKKITGGNSMNARMNYSNRTETVLTCTIVMECNTMLNIDGKVGEAEVGRFMDIPFVAYYSDDPKEYENSQLEHVYKKDTSLKTPTFKEDHRCALFHYIVEYGGIDEIYQPDIIRKRTKAYLTSKDEFSNWFFDKYEKDEDGKSVLKVKDIYNLYKEGDVYCNMNKKAKRMMNEKKFKLDLQGHMNFRMFYKERYKKDDKEIRNILLGFRVRQDDDDDKCKVPYPSDEEEELEEEPEC